jgi:hypothetical protein
MDKVIKGKWVEALRSKKYRQTQGGLCLKHNKRNSYCCLGVLARVQGATFNEYGVPTLQGELVGTAGKLGPALFAGIGREAINHLIYMNDSLDKSFSEISNYIEKEL